MSETHPIVRLIQEDERYKLDAYQFVRDALAYAQDELGMGHGGAKIEEDDETVEAEDPEQPRESHLTGQQLCEAFRQYAQDQYGYLAKVVLNSWGIHSTSDVGEIVYNLIRVELMKKSESDRREDFDDVYDFEEAFLHNFRITALE